MAEIVVIGSANLDFTVISPSLPRPGETLIGQRFFQECGGKGANQAVAAARLGGKVAMVARIGDDPAGSSILYALQEAGVDTAYVKVDPESASGTAHITVDSAGQNTIIVVAGANERLGTEDVERARSMIAAAKLVMLQLEIPLETARYALQVAHEYGVPVMLDPAPAPKGALPREFYALSAITTPNETEAEALCGFPIDGEEAAARAALLLRERGIGAPVVKLGAQGAIYLDGEQPRHLPAFRVETVDTTAAGDSFAAGLAVAMVEGLAQVEALRFASAVGALTATKYGAQSALPRRAEVEAFLAERA